MSQHSFTHPMTSIEYVYSVTRDDGYMVTLKMTKVNGQEIEPVEFRKTTVANLNYLLRNPEYVPRDWFIKCSRDVELPVTR